MTPDLDAEIDRNLFAFLPQIPTLLEQHRGEYALLRDQHIISLHKRLSEALAAAEAKFPDELFSIQQVTDKPIEQGFFGYADHSR